MSDSSCARCCQSESILSQLKEDFDKKVYTGKKGAKIKIGRVDLAEGHDWVISEGVAQRFNAGDLPAILVMHEGNYYKYPPDAVIDEDHTDASCLLHFINRLQHPLQPLKTAKEVETFLASENELVESTGFFRNNSPSLGKNYDDLRFKTRVIAFIFDKDESEEEIG